MDSTPPPIEGVLTSASQAPAGPCHRGPGGEPVARRRLGDLHGTRTSTPRRTRQQAAPQSSQPGRPAEPAMPAAHVRTRCRPAAGFAVVTRDVAWREPDRMVWATCAAVTTQLLVYHRHHPPCGGPWPLWPTEPQRRR